MQKRLANETSYRTLFLIAALYDFVLGFLFFIFWQPIFDNILKIPYPNYPAFYHSSTAFIFCMGIGFYFVYRDMYRNTDMVKLGILFKLAYTGLSFYYVFVQNMPWVFSIFGFLDIIFAVFFMLFLGAVRRETRG